MQTHEAKNSALKLRLSDLWEKGGGGVDRIRLQYPASFDAEIHINNLADRAMIVSLGPLRDLTNQQEH